MKKIFATMGMLLSLCSCEYNFNLASVDAEDKLSVTCVVNEQGKAYLNVELAAPVNKYPAGSKVKADIEEMVMTVNGQPCQLSRDSVADSTAFAGMNFWGADRKCNPGDEVQVRVKARGISEASCSTVVPGPIRIKGVETHPDSTAILGLVVKVDDVSPDGFYGVQISSYMLDSLWMDGELHIVDDYVGVITPREPTRDEDELIDYGGMAAFLPSYYSGFTLGPNVSRNGMYVFSGDMFDGDALTMECYAGRTGTYEYDMDDYTIVDGEWMQVVRHMRESCQLRLKVEVCRLSADFYRYARAMYIMDNNFFAEYGLSAPSFGFSNVNGGFGVCASLTSDSTDWFDVK